MIPSRISIMRRGLTPHKTYPLLVGLHVSYRTNHPLQLSFDGLYRISTMRAYYELLGYKTTDFSLDEYEKEILKKIKAWEKINDSNTLD